MVQLKKAGHQSSVLHSIPTRAPHIACHKCTMRHYAPLCIQAIAPSMSVSDLRSDIHRGFRKRTPTCVKHRCNRSVHSDGAKRRYYALTEAPEHLKCIWCVSQEASEIKSMDKQSEQIRRRMFQVYCLLPNPICQFVNSTYI